MSRIALAANYSQPLVRAIAAGQVHVDYLKCFDDEDLVRRSLAVGPTYVHFSLEVGAGKGDAVHPDTHDLADWARIESLLTATSTPHVSAHLLVWQADLDDDATIAPDDDQAAIIGDRAVRDVSAMVSRLGADRVVVEHSPPIGSRMAPAAYEPAVVCRVVEETGCGFLLDLAHARLAAIQMELDDREYVERLPLRHLREVHVSGVLYAGKRLQRLAATAGVPAPLLRQVADRYVDHMPMAARDWRLLHWATERLLAGDWPMPWCVASEYGGVGRYEYVTIPDLVVRQVQRLSALVSDGATSNGCAA